VQVPAEKLAENAAFFSLIDQAIASTLTDRDEIMKTFAFALNQKIYFVKGSDEKIINYTRIGYDRGRPDAGTDMAYFIYAPDEPAARTGFLGESVLARITFRFDRRQRCVTREIMEAHLGSAHEAASGPNQDNYFLWWAPLGRLRPEGTIVNGIYENGPIDGCIRDVWIGRYRESGSYR
jgi:hypothetical protein